MFKFINKIEKDLIKNVSRIDEIRKEKVNIEERMQRLKFDYEDNEQLQEYIGLLEKQEELEIETAEISSQIYEEMVDIDMKDTTIGNTTIVLTKPTVRKSVDFKKFSEDYGPETEEYKKYVKISNVKGHITIKERVEKKVKRKIRGGKKVESKKN